MVEVREVAAEIGRERRRMEDSCRMSEMTHALIARQDHMLHLLLDATGHGGLEVGEQNQTMREGKRQHKLVTMGLRNESADSPTTLWPDGQNIRGNTATAFDEFTRSNSNGHLSVSASVGHARLLTSRAALTHDGFQSITALAPNVASPSDGGGHAEGESGEDFCPLQRLRDDAWLVQHQRLRDDAWLVQHGVSAPPSASVGHAHRVTDEGVQR